MRCPYTCTCVPEHDTAGLTLGLETAEVEHVAVDVVVHKFTLETSLMHRIGLERRTPLLCRCISVD
jgi:hypothetical protein